MKPQIIGGAADIPPSLSLYFDLMRLLAAICVVFYHTWSKVAPGSTAHWPGHDAVVVFFVLSGYVIGFTGSRPGMTWAEYARHRVARVLPVAYVALLVALVIAVLKGSQSGALVWPTVANMLFIAQSGMLALEAPINSPFWSLNYEVWYYVIFAVWTFSAPKRRLSLTVLALVLAGPKIVLLLPVWLMGVWLQRSRPKLSHGAALVLFVVSWGLGMTMFALDLSDTIRSYLYAHISFMWRAHFSTQLVYDYLLGIAVTANFAAIAALPLPNWLKAPERLIRYLAGFTFSLYLFHVPLGELMYEVIGIRAPLPYYAAMAAGTFVLAQLTERRVRFYRALLKPRWRGSVAA